VLAAGQTVADPLWRMPLWDGYEDSLNSDIADMSNDSDAWAQAGSVTAALFLRRFAPATGVWAHLDVMAWNPRGRPGWPVGGELQGARAVYAALKRRHPPG
jgi:leucyl aminopeptidase